MVTHKICSGCKQSKPLTAFYKNKVKKDGLQNWCKKCKGSLRKVDSQDRGDISKNKSYFVERRSAWRKQGIQLTAEEFNRKYFDQKGCCSICNRHQSKFKKALSVDHNHETNQVRGLVCDRCNLIIGLLENQKDMGARAKVYLASWANKAQEKID